MIMKKQKIIPRLIKYLYPYMNKFILGQFTMLISLAAGLILPLIIKDLLDLKGSVLINVLILSTLAIVSGIANYLKDLMLGNVSNSIVVDIRNKLYRRLQDKSMDYYNNNNSGEIVSRMTNDINLFQQALSSGITYIVQMVISFIVIVILMFSMDWLLSLVMAIIFPLIMFITQRLSKPVKKVSLRALENLSEVTGSLNQSVTGISVIKSFSLEKFALKLFKNQNHKWLQNVIEQVKIKARTNMVISILNTGQIIAMLGIGVWRVQTGNMTVGSLTAFIMYAQSLSGPLSMISTLYVEIQKALAAVQRIFNVMDDGNSILENENPVYLDDVAGNIKFRNVTFSYADDKTIINNLSIDIPAGKTVAFVGSSGAGKTTLMNLIPRFYDVTSGEILIDGINIKHMSKESLRSHISIVPQSTYLFDMTIADNIACGNVDATMDQIITASKRANAHDFITNMKNGYDSMVGEGGVLLSGGQKQRIAIARAFLKGSEILLLDEATSALDNVSEKLVQNAIYNLMEGRTTLIVAHRLSTIIGADIIYVMENGHVVDQGNHKELLENSTHYRKIYFASLKESNSEEINAVS